MKRRTFVALVAGALSSGMAPVTAMPTPWMRSLRRSQRYLIGRQSKDGAWRSEVYGSFKSGEGLTPLVANACWGALPAEKRAATVEWLQKQGEKCWAMFPVHNAGWLLQLAKREKGLQSLAPAIVSQLRALQLGSKLGWRKDDPYLGGWSYARASASRVEGRLPAMQEPNLSATVLAVAGLRAAGVEEDDLALREAGRFIARCQNLASGASGQFDDGGFFQMSSDRSRNKAGVAGTDAAGRVRFRSYYSATVDGLRGLLMCGASARDPRVVAALKWLEKNPAMDDVPDLIFYASYARNEAASWLPVRQGRSHRAGSPERSDRLGRPSPAIPGKFPSVNALRQDHDGSFSNPAGEMRENDPLVATSLMLLSGLSGLMGRI